MHLMPLSHSLTTTMCVCVCVCVCWRVKSQDLTRIGDCCLPNAGAVISAYISDVDPIIRSFAEKASKRLAKALDYTRYSYTHIAI